MERKRTIRASPNSQRRFDFFCLTTTDSKGFRIGDWNDAIISGEGIIAGMNRPDFLGSF